MTNEEIKLECEKAYALNKQADARLMELRKLCKHEATHETNYSWRAGNVSRVEICSYCGEVIKTIGPAIFESTK